MSSPVAELRPHAMASLAGGLLSERGVSKGDGQQTYDTKEAHVLQPTTFPLTQVELGDYISIHRVHFTFRI